MVSFPLPFVILAAGLYVTWCLKFLQVRSLFYSLRLVLRPTSPAAPGKTGDITSFQALNTALAATIGTGNIAGVATAIFLGGPGAVFWMWVAAFWGMALKYAEITLAVHYRVATGSGELAGGPMYYLQKGLNRPGLAFLFALFGSMAAFGIGNMVQANSVAQAALSSYGFPPLYTGLMLALLSALVMLGGIKRIALVASALVPLMAAVYLAGGLVILILHFDLVPGAFNAIITAAFRGESAAGGFAGAAVYHAWRYGISRGIFTNEAGLGSASIAYAAARTTHPVRQGLWGITEVFIDTHLVCTVTALVLLVTGAWKSGLEGASMTIEAFNIGLPGQTGSYIVTIGLIFFAFSSLLSWSYYGEKCAEFILGPKTSGPYRAFWILLVVVGAVGGLRAVWHLADVLNGLMAFPNLVGLLGLTGVLKHLTGEYFGRQHFLKKKGLQKGICLRKEE